MPLKLNNEEFTEYMAFVKDKMPRGKDKVVTFCLSNVEPYQVMGKFGMMSKIAGEHSIRTSDTVVINNIEGVLTYYNKSVKQPGRRGVEERLDPDFLHFINHKLQVNTATDPALFYYLLKHSENAENAINQGKTPLFHQMKPEAAAQKTVSEKALEVKAINKIDELKEKNKKQLRYLYEAYGHSNWEDLITSRKEHEQDWESVLSPLYIAASANPKKMLDTISDAALDVAAKVTQALANGILKYEAGKFIWGREGHKKPNICTVPAGKTDNDDAVEWFVGYLRGNGNVANELSEELNKHALGV